MKFFTATTLLLVGAASASEPNQEQRQLQGRPRRAPTGRTGRTGDISSGAARIPSTNSGGTLIVDPTPAPTRAIVTNSVRQPDPTPAPTGIIPNNDPTQAPLVCEEGWVINHDLAQTSVELPVVLTQTTHNQKMTADGHFGLTITQAPYVPAGQDSVTIDAWCIDYDRPIGPNNYTMDVISAFDSEGLREGAIDKPEALPSLTWMVNNIDVGDEWSGPDCKGPIGWKEYQAAVWYVVDDTQGQANDYYTKYFDEAGAESGVRTECIAQQMAKQALEIGAGYEPDCSNPDEIIPLIMIVDLTNGTITNQVLLAEFLLADIEGMCECPDDRSVTDDPTPKTTTTPDDTFTTTSPSGTKGDPHFKTHGGEMYDFHGGCDLVLVDNPGFMDGLGMLIHIRTKIETWWSYTESSVIRIGDETVEITGDSTSEWLFVNGEANESLEEKKWYATKIGGLLLRYRHDGTNGEAHIYFGNSHSEKIVLRTFNKFVKVEIGIQKEKGSASYNDSLGMLGRFPDGKRVSRDGETVIEDVISFGYEWQVREDEPKLFHSYEGDWIVPAGQKCAMPVNTAEKRSLRQRRLAAGMPTEQAEKACAHLADAADKKACVFDVIATQDTNMAAVW